MINLDTVITLPNGFCTLDKLNPLNFSDWLESIVYSDENGILVETKYFEIITSFNQLFFLGNRLVEAKDLEEGMKISTLAGNEEIKHLQVLDSIFRMAKPVLIDKSKTFFANGFILK